MKDSKPADIYLEPRHDWVVIRPIRKERSQSGALVIPEGLAELPKVRVLAVGPEVEDIKVGSIVMPAKLPKYPVIEYTVNGEGLGVIREAAIVGPLHNLDESLFEDGLTTEEFRDHDETEQLRAKLRQSAEDGKKVALS